MKAKKRNPRDTQQKKARASALRILRANALKDVTGGFTNGGGQGVLPNDSSDPIC